ncbi:MAG: cytochrome c [Planctomycetota bacterium]
MTRLASIVLALAALGVVGCEDAERLTAGQPPLKIDASKRKPAPTAASGADLYALHCARCHGVEGDGKGTEKLATPARDFKAGGFAFGNTRDALFKTIGRGIAGKEMPAFRDVMTDAERWRLIDHLLTLMPKQTESDARARVLEPTDRPLIARGALYDGGNETARFPRGLLIGYPIGMSFEYRVDDPRLLKVREGGFVDRADWDGRGGARLEPLGREVYAIADGDPPRLFITAAGAALPGHYEGVRTEKDRAVLSYRLEGGTGVKEWNEVVPTRFGSGFRRCFEVTAEGKDLALELEAADPKARFLAEELPAGWIVRTREGRTLALKIAATAAIRTVPGEDGSLRLVFPPSRGATTRVTVSCFALESATKAVLDVIDEQIGG